MSPHEHAHIGQAHAFPRHVLAADTAEGLKDFGDIVRGNAPSVVTHRKDRDVGMALARDDNLARAAGYEVGHSVGQEIPHDLFHGGTIGCNRGERVHRHLRLTRGDLVCQRLDGPVHQGLHIQ